jgi:hypothetical protein
MKYALLNHEDGTFQLAEDKNSASTIVVTWISEGADLENITIVEGRECETMGQYTRKLTKITIV